MKNLLLVLTVFAFSFQSCSKSDDSSAPDPIVPEVSDPSPYEGRWRGTYTGDAEGIWSMDITSAGTISGWFEETGTGSRSIGNGNVTTNGGVSLTFNNEGSSFGQIEDTAITGTWTVTDPNSNTPSSGPFSGSKE